MIELPASGTTLLLGGLGDRRARWTAAFLGRELSSDPYTPVVIDYPAAGNATSIPTGVGLLDDALVKYSATGPVIAHGHSQGAEVISQWLRYYANTDHVGDNITFVLTGNPRRHLTGRGIGTKTWDGSIIRPTPIDTQHRVIDIARRYDGWAIKSRSWRSYLGMVLDHVTYQRVRVNDSRNEVVNLGYATTLVTAP